ncbi:hypothetical protein C8R44DRAFT_795374 [Mycena epipterygia]|nr:hypothetical protein C8R44DRAFT_795374 [Mycena epipterygia]
MDGSGSEEEGEDLHANAQSSLNVTMRDVDVRKRKRKRRVPVEVSSDSDDPAPERRRRTNTDKKKSRKKRAKRYQKSRSIKEVGEDRQLIVEKCYPFIQMQVAISNPWPAPSPSGDPAADDDEVEELLDEAWDQALTSLDLDPDDVAPRTIMESNLVSARIPQLRGAIMTAVDAAIPAAYGFVDPYSLKDPTPEKLAATREANRQLVTDLTGTFMYENPKETEDTSTICRHTIFQTVLNTTFFAKTGINCRGHYFAGLDQLPEQTFGLMLNAVMCGIDRWKTGEYTSKRVPFDRKTYADVYKESLGFLSAWISEYQLDVHPVDLATQRLQELLRTARMVSGTAVEPVQTRGSLFPMHVFGNRRNP